MAAGTEPGGHHAQEHKGERETEREGELPGQGGQEIAAVDGEARFEQKGQGGRGQATRPRITQTGQASKHPRRQGQGQRAEYRHQLEGDVITHDAVEQHGEQTWQREVEGVHREAVVPARIPASQVAVGEKVRLQELGQQHMRTRIAAGCGGGGQQK